MRKWNSFFLGRQILVVEIEADVELEDRLIEGLRK